MSKILFTGGGTVGHVSVNVALIPEFQKLGYASVYIGSKNGIEKEIISNVKDVKYYEISSGKLRRYFSAKNFTDPFRVLKGIFESLEIIRKEKPDFVFSKGGFVSVPVCIAAKILRIPTVLHESDLTPGLANKINIKFADHIFTTFEETLNYLPKSKSSLAGAIVRDNIYDGDAEQGYKFLGFSSDKPIILIMGGSLGSNIINNFIWDNIDTLIKKYQLVHLVGKGCINDDIKIDGYRQFEFLDKELFDVFKITNFTISRAGSNSIYEFLALKTPSILIPLGTNQSRGDQIENARYFKDNGFSKVIYEEDLSSDSLADIDEFYNNIDFYIDKINKQIAEKNIIGSAEKFSRQILEVLEVKI